MRIFSFAFACLIFVSTTTKSQYSIQLEAGTNLANASTPPDLSPSAIWKTRVGFVGDLLTSYSLSDEFSLQTGLRFIQKGTKVDFLYNLTMTHNYIEVPVYARFKVIDFGPQILVVGGPSFSFLTNSYTQGTSPIYGSLSHNTNEQYKSYDISLDAGVEFENPVTKNLSFIISAKYSFGFIEIDKTSANEQSRDLRLTLGFAYSL